MSTQTRGIPIAADVKCYFCGHVSGQMVGHRGVPLRPSNFVPRPGYSGTAPKPGARLRCERCQGPVYLENAALASAAKRDPGHQPAERVAAERGGAQAA